MSLGRRSVPAGTTVERIRSRLPAMGITRIANVTGLDTVELPVVSVCRPNGRTNSVFQGKGLDLDQAKASAIMEAVESHCAENILKPVIYASTAELKRSHRLADLESLARPRSSLYTPDRRILWIEGRGLVSGSPHWLPLESVFLDHTVPAPPGSGCFVCSSNGLASGNTLVEAVLHGLYEVVERDAIALSFALYRDVNARRLDLDTIDDVDSKSVLRRFYAAGLTVAVWEITSDIPIAAFRCQLLEREDGPDLSPLAAQGFGCHADRGIALARALAEAAQSRVTLIMGARDDMGAELYGGQHGDAGMIEWRRFIASTRGAGSFQLVTSDPAEVGPEIETAAVIDKLTSAELPEPIVVDLTPADMDEFAVVRVVVPGLEPLPEADCNPGRRLRRAIGAP